MITRRISFMLVVLVTAALAPLLGAPVPEDAGIEPIPVQGSVTPAGNFVGTLMLIASSFDDADQLHLTAVLDGTATDSTGAEIPVTQQPFIASATLHDPGLTTDVVLLAIAPIILGSVGLQIELARIIIDIYAIPTEGDVPAPLLPES